jgi:hypothetical protein
MTEARPLALSFRVSDFGWDCRYSTLGSTLDYPPTKEEAPQPNIGGIFAKAEL